MPENSLEVESLVGAARRIAIQDQVLHSAGEFLKRCTEIEPMSGLGKSHRALQQRGTRARAKSAFKQRLGPVHDYFRRIKIVPRAKAVALRARAIGRIEAE